MVALLDNFDYAPPRQRLPRFRREIARATARPFAAQPRINLLPVHITKLWSDQLPGVTDANYLPNKTGQGDKPYLLLGAAQSNNYDLKGHLKAKVSVAGESQLRDRILWRLATQDGDSYVPEAGTSYYNEAGDEVTIIVDAPRANDEVSSHLVYGFDADDDGVLSAGEVAAAPTYKWRRRVAGEVVETDHSYEVKVISKQSYEGSLGTLNGLATTWAVSALPTASYFMHAFVSEGVPSGSTAVDTLISRDKLTHCVGVLFAPQAGPGPSEEAVFSTGSELCSRVASSEPVYNWLVRSMGGKSTEVHAAFANSEEAVIGFEWDFEDVSFDFNFTWEFELWLALGKLTLGDVRVNVDVHRYQYTVSKVTITGVGVDVFDFDYDGLPPWPDWVRDGARIQSGYNTLEPVRK